jgi:radical SAM superfamily enzyme with C-terminal helix-hairpin-helix motif
VPFPLKVNTAARETLEAVPGIGKKRALRILVKRPFQSKQAFLKEIDDPTIASQIADYVSLD